MPVEAQWDVALRWCNGLKLNMKSRDLARRFRQTSSVNGFARTGAMQNNPCAASMLQTLQLDGDDDMERVLWKTAMNCANLAKRRRDTEAACTCEAVRQRGKGALVAISSSVDGEKHDSALL